jgi:tRNA nucleotidyltransferase (CCA-adding enzyme)
LLDRVLAVLPRRLNRNVQAYLTLYGDGLPFIDQRDLPRRKIERVTLVDTQALGSVRGLTPETPVHVIDHHPAAETAPPAWTRHIEEVGATTTLLVEDLQEFGVGAPSIVPATLLLLGIYEDTGSLSAAPCAIAPERGSSNAAPAWYRFRFPEPPSHPTGGAHDRLLSCGDPSIPASRW